ncbi:MAG: YafY family protein [Flavitalea sp.]
MDINKRFDRILQIFFLLQSKAVVSMSFLQEKFGTSKRTIYRDLNSLEHAGVPILFSAGSEISIMEGYRINPSRFTQEEALSLLIAEKMMAGHETQFIQRNFEKALAKIRSSFQFYQKTNMLDFEQKFSFKNSRNKSAYLPDVIEVLLNGSVKKQVVSINYKKSSETRAEKRNIEPVGLFYESEFWYLLAWCQSRNDYRNFRLDRIESVSPTMHTFSRVHLSADEIKQLKNPPASMKITIKVVQKKAHFLFWERQNFGFTNEEIEKDEVIMHFDCETHPTSFVRWLMKFADITEIIAPDSLRHEFNALLLASLKKAKITHLLPK